MRRGFAAGVEHHHPFLADVIDPDLAVRRDEHPVRAPKFSRPFAVPANPLHESSARIEDANLQRLHVEYEDLSLAVHGQGPNVVE